MQINDQLKIYREPYTVSPKVKTPAENGTSVQKIDSKKSEFKNLNPENANQVITRKERDFFIKMFPENSDQLEKHVLFTRNGKLQSPAIGKGMIIDGRV